MSYKDVSHNATREALLNAGCEVFAEHGFKYATVRMICMRAGANLAAVNYHFGSKKGLYVAIMKHSPGPGEEFLSVIRKRTELMPPEQRLREFIRAMFQRLFNQERSSLHGKLIEWELLEPSEVLEEIVTEQVMPLHDYLFGIVRELAEGRLEDQQAKLCVASLMSQCMQFRHARPVIERLNPELDYSPACIDMMADHIANFSLAAIKHLKVNHEHSESKK